MLAPDRRRAASALLFDLWQSGGRVAALPPELRPATRAEGHAIQAHVEERSAPSLFGWKIAATSVAGQRHINVDGPLAGRLLAERVLGDGAAVPIGRNHMRVAEIEFAFRMGRDLPPRGAAYEVEEVMAAVDTRVSGRYQREGKGANVLGDPRVALTWLANELSQLCTVLKAGQVVTTGTCVVPLELRPGDEIVGSLGALGDVSVRLL